MLSELSQNDARSCLNTLQFLKQKAMDRSTDEDDADREEYVYVHINVYVCMYV